MIVFIDKLDLIEPLHDHMKTDFSLYDLSSYYSQKEFNGRKITDISKIILSFEFPEWVRHQKVFCEEDPQFDIFVSYHLLNNMVARTLFQILMSNIPEGKDSYVLVAHDWYRDAMMESITKHIQVRYGLNCWIVKEPADIELVDHGTLSINGLEQIKLDMKYNAIDFVNRIMAEADKVAGFPQEDKYILNTIDNKKILNKEKPPKEPIKKPDYKLKYDPNDNDYIFTDSRHS